MANNESQPFVFNDPVAHRVVQGYPRTAHALVQILQELQHQCGGLPPSLLKQVADYLQISYASVRGVAEFYSFLKNEVSQYTVLLSDNITDQMLGSRALLADLCARLHVEPGQFRADGRVRVDTTSCIGMNDQGPAALINGYPVTRLNRERIAQIADFIDHPRPLSAWPTEWFVVETNIRRTDALLGTPLPPGTALQALIRQGADAALAEIAVADLRGHGGAGFKTATKWMFCRKAEGNHVVICNADEGEPGTFKDRVLLQAYADLVIEGMTVCALIIGSRQGFIYLRGEYRYLFPTLQATLQRRRDANLLGPHILGVEGCTFDIEVHLGAGAYVCGEESALIESLEGKRGVPRNRPPFPVTCGYLNQPTVVNNVETFANAAWIVASGSRWLTKRGTPLSTGSKLLSISGDVACPGIYEYPWGVTVRQVLDDCGAQDPQAVQLAGAAGHLLTEKEFGRRIAYEDVPTGGSLMVFSQKRDILDAVNNFAEFFVHESCGFCTPCRIGTSLMRDLINKIHRGHGTASDLGELRSLGRVMQQSSSCGLGQTAATTVLDVLDKCPQIFTQRLRTTDFEPSFDLENALLEARQLVGRQVRPATAPRPR